MSDRAAQFELWHPQYRALSDRLETVVDVVPADIWLIDQGDDELICHFAERLGLPSQPAPEWSISPFATPYYAYDPDSDELPSRISPAWRLTLRTSGSAQPPKRPAVGPVPAWGDDSTWWAHKRPWDWSGHEVVVIALDGPDPNTEFLGDVGPNLSTETVFFPQRKFTVSQLRISLGRLNLNTDLDVVDGVVEACRRKDFSTHKDEADELFMQ